MRYDYNHQRRQIEIGAKSSGSVLILDYHEAARGHVRPPRDHQAEYPARKPEQHQDTRTQGHT